ncbi:hypothetical protein GQ457_14G009960 [Hibiscus cannabinus]
MRYTNPRLTVRAPKLLSCPSLNSLFLIIEVEVSGLNGLQYDEEHALNFLLDAFGSVISLKDIASAYCEAKWNCRCCW